MLSASHTVNPLPPQADLVVAKDGERMLRQSAGRHVQHAGHELAADLVPVSDEQGEAGRAQSATANKGHGRACTHTSLHRWHNRGESGVNRPRRRRTPGRHSLHSSAHCSHSPHRSPGGAHMLGIMSSRPWEEVKVVAREPAASAPCSAPATPASLSISVTCAEGGWV